MTKQEQPNSLKGKAEREISGGSQLIKQGNLMAITVDSISIFPKNFLSRDLGGEREGLLNISVNGQNTTFPFKGKGKSIGIEPKYLNKIIFFGQHHEPIQLKIQLIESDENFRKALDKVGDVADIVSGASIPGLSFPIGSATGLLGAVSRFIGSKIKDDDEVLFLGIINQSKDGQTLKLSHSNSPKGVVLESVFNFHDLGEIDTTIKAFRIAITNPEIKFSKTKIIIDPDHYDRNFGPKEYTPFEYLNMNRDLKRFNFYSSSGNSNQALSTYTNSMKEVLVFEELELFTVNVNRSGGVINTIPFSYSFSFNSEKLNAERLLDIAKSAVDLASAFGVDTEKPQDFLKKQGQSAISQISEFAQSALSVSAFDGVLFLTPNDSKLPSGAGRKVMTEKSNGKWRETIEDEIRITINRKMETIGTFSFNLEIDSIG